MSETTDVKPLLSTCYDDSGDVQQPQENAKALHESNRHRAMSLRRFLRPHVRKPTHGILGFFGTSGGNDSCPAL